MTCDERAAGVRPACNAAFVIRDGVLTIPSWEWSSTKPAILGYPVDVLILPRANVLAHVQFSFENDWAVCLRFPVAHWVEPVALEADEVGSVAIFAHRMDGPLTDSLAHVSANALLRLIADIASRPPYEQEGGTP